MGQLQIPAPLWKSLHDGQEDCAIAARAAMSLRLDLRAEMVALVLWTDAHV
jgi:hypothetical protein